MKHTRERKPEKLFTADMVSKLVVEANQQLCDNVDKLCKRVAIAEQQRDELVAVIRIYLRDPSTDVRSMFLDVLAKAKQEGV